MRFVAIVLLSACSGPASEPTAPDNGTELRPPSYLTGADQVLPGGVVGQAYEASGAVSGGVAPYTWELAKGAQMPGGLRLGADGLVHGVPSQAGEHTFAVVARDAEGRTKLLRLTVTIRLDPVIVACGETIGGRFYGSAMDFGGPNFDDLHDLAWIGVQVPRDLTQRIELQFGLQSTASLYVQRPSEPLGSWDLEDEYVPYFLSPPTRTRMTLDPGTNPSLSGYLAQPTIPLLLVAQGPGDWSLEVICTDGPVFERLAQYPTELGQPLAIDYDVWGPDAGVRIYPTEPLPDWMIWDEATGEVTGTTMEAGAWEFTVVAEAADGRRREARSIIGVYAVEPVVCNQIQAVQTTQTYFDGEFGIYWDPRGYRVYRLDLAEVPVSYVDLRLVGADGHYLGVTDPAPGWLKFFPGGDADLASSAGARVVVDPTTYAGIRHYVADGQMYIVAAPTQTSLQMELSVICDLGPRLDMAALPVVEPFVAADHALRAIGGTPPYSITASGLPQGLSVRGARLVGTTGQGGAFPVQLTVTDATGATDTGTRTLYSGIEWACADATPVSCGDSVDGRFTSTYFADGNGPDSTEVFCVVDQDGRSLGWEIYSDGGELRVDVGDPGATVSDMWNLNEYTYVSFVERDSSEGVSVNPWSWPDLDDYEHAAVRLAIRSYNPGDWTVHLTCQ